MSTVADLKKGPPCFGLKKIKRIRKAGRQSNPPPRSTTGMYVLYLYCIVFVFCAQGGNEKKKNVFIFFFLELFHGVLLNNCFLKT